MQGSDFKTIGWFEALMCLIFPYTDIERDDAPGVIYLRRWFISPRTKEFLPEHKGKGRLMLHKFYRGDDHEDHFHDHPWSYTSFILTRGYYEETPWRFETVKSGDIPTEGIDGDWRSKRFYRRWSVLKRPAIWRHRVLLKDEKPVWTIVRTGVKERNWGFWIKDKLCPWRNYNNGICWCEPDTEPKPEFE